MKANMAHFLIFSLIFSAALPMKGANAPETVRKTSPALSEATRVSQADADVDLLLQPDDVIRVQVFQEEDINKQGEVRVSKDAAITLPLIGVVNLKGKTVRQAEEMIRRLYDKDYLVNPQVNVIVIKFAERFVNVNGAVNKADRVPLPPNGLTIVDAISAAGGPSRIADLKRVKLKRRNADGEISTIEVNVDAMTKSDGKDGVQPLHLEKDDSIFVPERIL